MAGAVEAVRLYHGRRRSSLPTLKLSSSERESLGRIKSHECPRSPQPGSPRVGSPRLGSQRLGSPQLELGSRRPHTAKPSPLALETPRCVRFQDPVSLSPSSPGPQGFRRGRRHSVDTAATPSSTARLSPPGRPTPRDPNHPVEPPQDVTRQAWEQLCKESDPAYFDTQLYEKDALPGGSSAFQSALRDVHDNEDADDSESDTNTGEDENTRTSTRSTTAAKKAKSDS